MSLPDPPPGTKAQIEVVERPQPLRRVLVGVALGAALGFLGSQVWALWAPEPPGPIQAFIQAERQAVAQNCVYFPELAGEATLADAQAHVSANAAAARAQGTVEHGEELVGMIQMPDGTTVYVVASMARVCIPRGAAPAP